MHDNLTPNQIEVRDLLIKGLSNKEIALSLSRTVTSTEKLVSLVMRKYKCTSRAEVIATHFGLR